MKRAKVGVAGIGVAAALMFAAPVANAAPGDVTATAKVSGNTVSLIVHNGSANPVRCVSVGTVDQQSFNPSNPTNLAFASVTYTKVLEDPGAVVGPGADKAFVEQTVTPGTPGDLTGSTTIPAGQYDLFWACGTDDGREYWGTPPLAYGPNPVTPIDVTVPSTGPQPTSGCSGSICLPFGSRN